MFSFCKENYWYLVIFTNSSSFISIWNMRLYLTISIAWSVYNINGAVWGFTLCYVTLNDPLHHMDTAFIIKRDNQNAGTIQWNHCAELSTIFHKRWEMMWENTDSAKKKKLLSRKRWRSDFLSVSFLKSASISWYFFCFCHQFDLFVANSVVCY